MAKKKEMVEMSFEVDAALYDEAKEVLRQISVTPEYAAQQFLKECVRRKKILISRFKEGENAEDLISETADAAISRMARQALDYRKMLAEMKIVEKEITITDLRLHWGKNLKWVDGPGHMLVVTRNGKREVAVISVETDLAVTSVATDDKTIQNRCALLELMG